MKRSEFNLLVENWRKFLKDGVIQEQTEDFDYYADEIEKQPEAGNSQDDFDVYADVNDQSDSDVETANQDSKSEAEDILPKGTKVQVFNLKDYNNRNNDRLFDDSVAVGDAWENAGIFFTNSGMDVVVDKYVPGEGYTLRDSEDKNSILYGIPEENVRMPISDEEDKQLYYSTPEGQADLEDKYAQMDPVDKEDLYSWARSRANAK